MMLNKTKTVLVFEFVAVFLISAGCGSYKSDLEKMCNVEVLSGVPLGELDVMQAARMEWLDGEISSWKGKELFEALGSADPYARANILKEQAREQGIAECPHAEMISFSISESSNMQLPVSAFPAPLVQGIPVLINGQNIYVDGLAVVRLENGLVPVENLQAVAEGAFIKPLSEYLSEQLQKAAMIARRTGNEGAPTSALLVADYRIGTSLIMLVVNTLKQAGMLSLQLAVSIQNNPWRYAAISTSLTAQTAGPTLTVTPQGFVLTPYGQNPVQIPKVNNSFNWGTLSASLRQFWMGVQNQIKVRVNGNLSYGELISTINTARVDGSGWLYPNLVLIP